MLSFGLMLALFLFWEFLGFAVVSALHSRRNLLQNALLAPAVGMAVTVIPLFWLSRSGFAVRQFGLWVTITLLVLAAGLTWRLRPRFPLRQWTPFAAIFLLASVLTGRPMLEFGFNWASYLNDDMVNYVLGAHRLLDQPYLQLPDMESLALKRDATLGFWFYAVLGIRPGSELMLAWLVSLTSISGLQVFMPLIMAFHLALISASGALMCCSSRHRLAASLTCLWLGFSALSTLGVLYQLVAQVFGLGLLAGSAAVLVRFPESWPKGRMFRSGLLAALLVSALFIAYPETIPFLAASVAGIWAIQQFVLRRTRLSSFLVPYGTAGICSLLILNVYLQDAFTFLRLQTQVEQASLDVETSVFPYYLIPSGLANLWGLQPISVAAEEPWLSSGIVLGGLLLLAACAAAVSQSRRGHPAALLTLVMLFLALYLFARRVDFGLFKLAMFIQPFMTGTVVVAWLALIRDLKWSDRRKIFPGQVIAVAPILLCCLLGNRAQNFYVERSRGENRDGRAGLTEVPGASATRFFEEAQQVAGAVRTPIMLFDTANNVLAKCVSVYTKGKALSTPSKDHFRIPSSEYFQNAMSFKGRFSWESGLWPWPEQSNSRLKEYGLELIQARQKVYRRSEFDLLRSGPRPLTNAFSLDIRTTPPGVATSDVTVIQTLPSQSGLNRRHFNSLSIAASSRQHLKVQPWEEVKNHLVLVHSERGQHYFIADRRQIALFPLEPDFFYKASTMSGVGRYLLFQIINPARTLRLGLELTATLKGDAENRLPPAAAIGAARQALPFVGRGSARVFSAPLIPQTIFERPFLGIDMGVDGTPFVKKRSGLMALYGTDVPLDYRYTVAFARDISVVTEEEYQNLRRPNHLKRFPEDLANPGLEYSGIYEDGWVSEAAFFTLDRPAQDSLLVIRGSVPTLGDPAFRTELQVLVDQRPVLNKVLPAGDFDLQMDLRDGPGQQHRIDLRFGTFQRLPSPDSRPVGAQLEFVGYETAVTSDTAEKSLLEIVPSNGSLQLGPGWYPYEQFAGESFRWVRNEAHFSLPQRRETKTSLFVELEPGPGLNSRAFRLQVLGTDGREVATAMVRKRQSVEIILPLEPGRHNAFRFHVEGGDKAIPNDPRLLNFRVFKMWLPAQKGRS